MRRVVAKTLAALVVIVAIAAFAAYTYARRSLPVVNGTIELAGLEAPVDIVRDADNIPHIFAARKTDAFFGLGYVHAQDRLWQMEFQRRIGHGRLSEVFGEVTVPQDRFLRTVGFGRAARAAWDRLPEDVRLQLDAYVSGVNAFLADRRGSALPPEFALLRIEPEPWTGPDVLVWVKMMAWDLSENYSLELLRHDLLARVGPERTAELMPPYPAAGLNILAGRNTPAAKPACCGTPRSAAPPGALPAAGNDRVFAGGGGGGGGDSTLAAFTSALSRGDPAVQALLTGAARTEALGSNNWVVGGARTASGKPLLANDPHLGTQVPSLWYLAHLSAGDFDVIGATLPGAPAVAIGRNRFIAWGATNVGADVEDLYRERLDPSGRFAEFRGVQEPLRLLTETVAVRGGAPVQIDVRISRHGPLVSDAINANNAAAAEDGPRRRPIEPLALRWTALDADDSTVVAFLRLNEARDWIDFKSALRHFVVPSQNFVYADVQGHIGYYAPGRIPIRARGDGSAPVEGWIGDAEWAGWIPFDELPHAYDPPEHLIVTANNRPGPAGEAHLIALDYPEPYRAQRITEMVRGKVGLTPEDFRVMQADTHSLHAERLLPLLLRHVDPRAPGDREAVELLKRWNYDASGDSAATPIFQGWFLRLARTLAGDELGPVVIEGYQGRFSYVTRFVINTLSEDESPWCDDVGTARRETCAETVTAALHDGVADLTRQLGGDMAHWRWEAVHRAVFQHLGLGAVPVLRPLLGRTVPNAGDWSTVNVGTVSADRLFEQHAIPSYRQIVDLSPANDSRFLDAVGQSGHFLSGHYAEYLGDWRAVRHRRMRMGREEIDAGAVGRLRLVPAR